MANSRTTKKTTVVAALLLTVSLAERDYSVIWKRVSKDVSLLLDYYLPQSNCPISKIQKKKKKKKKRINNNKKRNR